MKRNRMMTIMIILIVCILGIVGHVFAEEDMVESRNNDVGLTTNAEEPDYLSFTAEGGSVTIGMIFYGSPADFIIDYSRTKNGTWTFFAQGGSTKSVNNITINNGETVYFKNRQGGSNALSCINYNSSNYARFTMSGSGNINAVT